MRNPKVRAAMEQRMTPAMKTGRRPSLGEVEGEGRRLEMEDRSVIVRMVGGVSLMMMRWIMMMRLIMVRYTCMIK